MAQFEYKAYDASGNLVSSITDSESIELAREQLTAQGLMLISLTPKNTAKAITLFNSDKLSLNDLEFITAELALLLRSGVKIDRSLRILSKGKADSASGRLMQDLASSVKKGESLTDAFAKHKHFDALYVSLIKMGEASGELAEVFAGLARDLKFRKELQAKITQAMVYPSVIFVVCLLAIIFVFNFIVPQMSGLFDDSDNLPLYTSFLIGASNWMQQYQWYLLLTILAIGYGVKVTAEKGLLSRWLDEHLIKVPVFRSAILQIERIRFNTSMALMLDTGVKLDTAIELAADTVKNTVLRNSLLVVRSKVKRGVSLTNALSSNPIYPDFYLSLLEVGEESGQLSKVFEEIASRSRNDFSGWTTKITSLLEPLMILFMGGIVGSVVVVMLLSIMSVNDGF